MANNIVNNRKSLFIKVLAILLAVCLSVFIILRVLVPVILNTFWGNDIAPINDSALSQLSVVSLSESENSYYDLVKITDINLRNIPEGKDFTKDFLSSDSWEDSKVDALLKDNELALQYFNEAANKSKFQSPTTADPNNISEHIDVMNPWRQVARLNCVKAIQLAKNGQNEEALSESMKVLAVGDAIERSQNNTVTYLVALSMKDNAVSTLQKIISNPNFDKSIIPKYKDQLSNYNLSNNDSMWKLEYLYQKGQVINLASGKYDSELSSGEYNDTGIDFSRRVPIKTSYYFKPNLTIRELYDYYSKLIDNFKSPCIIKYKELKESDNRFNPVIKWYFTENAFNKILISLQETAFSTTLTKKCNIQNNYLNLLHQFE